MAESKKNNLRVAKDIKDSKQKELYKSQLASIVEYSEDGIESMDIDGNILSWNKGAEKIYGYKASEIIGKNAIQLYPKDQKTELKNAITKIKNGESVAILETKRKRKDGKTIDVSISFSPLRNAQDKVIGISVITRDITEQIKDKRALKESELRYQTIFEESGNAILIMSKNKIISCNNTLTQLFGYNKKEIIGKSPIYFSPEYQFEDVSSEKLGTEYIQKAFKTGYVSFEWKHMNKNGKVLNTYISLKKVEINGKPYLISILHDLTEIREYQFKLKEKNEEFLAQNEEYRVLNEELHEKNQQLFEVNTQLEQSEKKFRAAFMTSPDAVNINRLSDGLYIDINRGFTKLTGFTEEDVKGKTSADINIWVNKKDREELVKGLKKDGYVENLEAEFKRKDGSITTALMSANILEIDGEQCILSITRDIAEKKQAEEKIRKLSKGIDQSPAICVITDVEGNIEYVNPRFTELTGYTYEEAIGQNPRILKSDYHPKEFYTKLWNTIKSGSDFRCEMYNKKKNGDYYWESALISPIKDKYGLITNFIAIKEDITEKKRTEEQVKELNFRISLANDSAQIGVWDFDLVKDEMVWDANMFKLYGVNPHKFKASYDAWKNALHKDDAQWAIKECEDALNNKGEFHPIFRIVRPDKTVRYIEAHAKVIYDKDGKALRMTGVNWDVTQRVEREKELRIKDIAIQSSLSAIGFTDLEGYLRYVNKSFIKLWGYNSEKEIIGRHFSEFAESDHHTFEVFENVTSNKPYTGEGKGIRKNGSKFFVQIAANLVKGEDGKPLYMMASFIDIDARKKAERENANLATMVDIAPNAVLIHDFEGNILFTNQRNLELHGYTEEEFYKLNLKEIDVPESATLIKTRMEEIDKHGEATFEVEHLRKDKSTFPLLMYVKKVDWFGKPVMLSIGTDITERKKSEQELQASLERNNAILEANPDLMFVFSGKGDIVDYKAEKDTELLIPPEVFLGKNVKEVLPEHLATLTFEKIEKVRQTGKMEIYSYTMGMAGNTRFYESRMVTYGKNNFLAIVRDITQKQLDEIKLRESKQKLKDAMKTASLGSWELDLIHNKLYWSEEMFTLFDVDETKVNPTYELFVEHIHSDDQKFVERSYKDSLKDKMPYEIKYRIITSRGKLKYVKEKRRSIFDNNGSPVKTVGVIQDISDLKRIELDLRKAKDRAEERQNYSKIIAELSKKVIEPELSVKEIGEIIYKHALKLTSSTVGYVSTIDTDSEDLVSHTLSEMMPGQCNVKDKRIAFPKGKDGYNGLYGHALNTKESFFTNNPDDHIASEGLPEGHVPLQNFLTVPVLVKNKLLGQIALANKPSPYDINDLRKIEDLANIYGMAIYRKNTEDELINAKERAESSEEKYQAFITQSSEGICRMELEKPLDPKMDVEKQIDFFYDHLYLAECNERFAKMYNAKSSDELINKKLIDFHRGRNNKANRDTTRNVILNGYNIIGAISEEKTLDGKDIVFRTNVVGIFEKGRLVRMWETQTDVTEEMKLKKELIEAKEKAEESDKLKSAFLANMSHEIRTPMNAIRGFAQLLVEADFPKEKQQNFLNIINTRTQDLLVLIDDIIDISKIEANQLTIHNEEFSLNKMLFGLYAEKEAEVKKNPAINFRLDLGPNNEKLIVKADSQRIKQVLQNLISNAVKFTRKGEISFGYTIRMNKIQFYVKDTGIGISKKSQEIIFERFRQVDGSSTRKYGGTGLGLNISKQIVNLMGGEIWVESEEGEGATFFFTVPYKSTKKNNHKPQQNEDFNWKGKNILIVEDDEVNLYYLCELLELTKVNIYQAKNGEESLKLVKNNEKIDLVLLDINLPDMSGNEVVKRIRTFNKTLPVIAQSAYSMKEEIDKSMKYGFSNYVTKPIDSTLLLSIIDKYLKEK